MLAGSINQQKFCDHISVLQSRSARIDEWLDDETKSLQYRADVLLERALVVACHYFSIMFCPILCSLPARGMTWITVFLYPELMVFYRPLMM